MAKATFGINENIVSLLCYLIWPISGLVIFLVEKENKFVRFHAMQSIIVWIAGAIITTIISGVGDILMLILWIFLMYKSYKGEYYKLPYIGDLSEKLIKKLIYKNII
ncbi:DUF4870 domain-containing protein [Methanococcus aeolicus]|uniref:DUF4870 domain-containing protein n=1 Tax=Methanococcus aeolicus TaxID=42879 RepID=UPI0021CAADA0|nr:hypothetical protein [Methanococcus aeolicus]UXM85374.1 hypothetical protein N6C89_03610 [Methanococcus aeolicus]